MQIFDRIYEILKDFITSYIAMIKKLVEGFQGVKNDVESSVAANENK